MNKMEKALANQENILFVKESCAFCSTTKKLASKLEETKILKPFEIFTLDIDFSLVELKNLLKNYGWKPTDSSDLVSLPQIYIQGEYIGGNNDFYKSKYNEGDENNQIEVDGKLIKTPNKINPMNF